MSVETAHADDPRTCSICVCTYRRPQQLAKLLDSLGALRIPEHLEAEVVVVDNDAAASARETVARACNTNTLLIQYEIEPEKNISLARNRAVDRAQGEFILILDDDQSVGPDWLVTMVETAETYQADAVVGRVVPEFPAGTPAWLAGSRYYGPLVGATGSAPMTAHTGNSLIRAAALAAVPGPFEPRLGLSGGEDSKLFAQMRAHGAAIVSSWEGWATESVGPERATVGWLVRRARRTGGGWIMLRFESARRPSAMRAWVVVRSSAATIVSLVLAGLTYPARSTWLKWRLHAASNRGQVMAALGRHEAGY